MYAVATNELTTALGAPRREPARAPSRTAVWPAVPLALAASAVATLSGFAVWGDPSGGQPWARAEITMAPSFAAAFEAAPGALPARPARESGRATVTLRSGSRDAVMVEAASGVSVLRPPGTSAPTSVIVTVPDAVTVLSPAPDPRLVDRTRDGLLPRIGPDGAKAVDVYGRPAGELPGGAAPAGRIAIVVGGLGLSRLSTDDALARLPPAVTFAFAPYGAGLDVSTRRARAAGHETVLQLPMEPLDYPASDPGPQVLLAGAKPAENLDRLRWAMGRFVGYVAVMNYMGAKLASEPRAIGPILAEVAARGVGVVDDGSSGRSGLVSAGAGAGARAARADLVLDAVPRPEAIDKALARLETLAASGSVVVATASALPVSIDRIARWAKDLEARGVLLVPLTAALAAPRPPGTARAVGPSAASGR